MRLSVADNGSGMAPEVRDRVFEPFFTTKEVGKGTGLGLSMVYGFVRQSDGHVTIESTPGAGTTVTLYLPRAEQTAEAEMETIQTQAVPGGHEQILVVEDNEDLLEVTSAMLTTFGYRVLCARNGAEAIQMFENGQQVELLLSDVVMPNGMNGVELGCTVVLKPSELSPLSALLFAEVMDDAGCPPGVFNLVNGTGPIVGASLASHPQVDMISITGSTRAGVLVAQAAAPTVKRVAQELGGKSPNIILPDAELSRALPLGVGAAFRNLGQSCSAPTRMLVSRSQMAEVEVLAAAAASEIVVGDPLAENTTHGPIANRPQFERVQTMIGVGLEEGAKLVIGGPGRPDNLQVGLYARPTIFSNVRHGMRIAHEEIFGPVLSIIPYDTVEEAVEIANDTVYGLGAHVQGTDMETVRAVAGQIRSGQVHLNYPDWDPNAPFGGYKRSGNGREYGLEGMEEYLETKAVLGFYR